MKVFTRPLIITLALLVLLVAAISGCLNTAGGGNAGTTPVATPGTITQQITAAPSGTAPGTSSITITQSNGEQVTLPGIPRRIIATNSDVAEMLIALGAADSIVGITDTVKNVSYIMDRIPQAQSIGNWQTPNIELMLALRPDAVISYASSKPKNLDQITAANMTVIYLDTYRLPKLPQDARALGTLTGHSEKAEAYARLVENISASVVTRVSTIPRDQIPRVYFEGYSNFTAAGTGSGSDEMLWMAGGRNIVANLSSSSSPKVSAEWVVSERPDYIMKVVASTNNRPFQEIAQEMTGRTGWSTLPAVQQGRVYLFSNSIEYGPKAYIGLAYTAKALHPDLFRDLDPGQMLTEYAAQYVAGTDSVTTIYPEPA
jgi:iron complex transport system substrate-binding protein